VHSIIIFILAVIISFSAAGKGHEKIGSIIKIKKNNQIVINLKPKSNTFIGERLYIKNIPSCFGVIMKLRKSKALITILTPEHFNKLKKGLAVIRKQNDNVFKKNNLNHSKSGNKTKKRLSLYYSSSRHYYEEPNLMSISSTIEGTSFEFTSVSNFYWSILVEQLKGSGFYDGHLQDGTPITTTTHDDLTIVRLLFGSSENIYRIGYSARTLEDELKGASGYRRNTTYRYIPVGFIDEYKLTRSSVFNFSFLYNFFLSGENYSYLSDVDDSLENVHLKQKKGDGFSAVIEYIHTFDNSWDFGIKYSYNKWNIEQSEEDNGYIEPANFTKEKKVSIGVGVNW
jgi:hypothetical protein